MIERILEYLLYVLIGALIAVLWWTAYQRRRERERGMCRFCWPHSCRCPKGPR